MASLRLTDSETRLAEQYVSVLDFVSRCALGIDRGDWYYLQDKAGQLARAAETLAAVTTDVALAARQRSRRAPQPPRAEAVRAAVAWFGRHYRAARLLHPQPPAGGEPQ